MAKAEACRYSESMLMLMRSGWPHSMKRTMKRTFFFPLAAWAVLLAGPNASAPEADFKPEAGFVSLYNGKDLTGWSYRDKA